MTLLETGRTASSETGPGIARGRWSRLVSSCSCRRTPRGLLLQRHAGLARSRRADDLEGVHEFDAVGVGDGDARDARAAHPDRCVAGAALGLSGVILQGVTRNPLADPGIMGINAGAAAFIVSGIMILGVHSGHVVWLAFLGAGVATVTVYGIASFGREGATPVKLALAGAAVTAVLTSLTSAIVMTNVDALNELRFWQVGSLAGRYMPVFWQTAPFIVLGLIVAILPAARSTGWPLARTSRWRSASGSG